MCQIQPSKHPVGELQAKTAQDGVTQDKVSGREGQEQLVGAQLPRIMGPRGPDVQASGGPMIEENNEDSPIPDITNKAGTVGATLAGSSLFLLMMYKYTPLGSWVSTKILGRNKLMENMRKNNYELLLNDVGNNEASLNDPMYHIRYNSATNH
ncbi:hypothetical protein PVBG_06018 [Plasmodium vivax Brazil I]|uniref:Vir protein n=1 Tax=Plasmodium vivax (strain Brazil I) TaxID=1033975 RepID=A0A0J9T0V5_PLAV1|nr:hypothetical protein PVBG_06018 [Plasmodium vivax Brazil I]